MNKEDTYNLGANLTHALIKKWLRRDGESPRFAFPPKEVALIADLRDVGKNLARNDSARGLVDHLIDQVVFQTGQAPTAMMLLIILEDLGQSVERLSFSELGIKLPRGAS